MDSGLGACVVGDCRSAEPSVDAGRVARGVGWHSESAAWKSESASRHRRRRPLLERAACASVSSGQLQPRRRWHWPWQRRGKANSKRTVPAVDTATPEPPLQQAMAAPAAKPARSSSLAAGLSGAMSGMLIGASLQPLDVLRTRMQGDAAQGILRSAPQTLLHILRTQGLPGLWIGIGPSVVRLGAGVGLHMCLVENLAAALSRPLPAAGGGGWHIPPLSAALASGSSRALSSVLLCPLAVAKTRMEYAGPGAVRYRDTLDALATIARSEGPQALFRGLLPTIVTNAPFSGLYYMFYIRLKEQLSDEHRPKVYIALNIALHLSLFSDTHLLRGIGDFWCARETPDQRQPLSIRAAQHG
mmetsp:Transcript_26587/g.78985  ORF Transcript_26587/g.78985 Transcript_26587/m.78985 type:complete len:358 (+) Transcript_26587:321-1394(+)